MSQIGMSPRLSGGPGSVQGTPAHGEPEAQQPTQVSAMPLPPMQYVKLYSEENQRRGTCPPPPPPLANTEPYRMFGQAFSPEDCIISSLESQGIPRLYSTKDLDRKKELKKLNHSILVNFLDLLDLLIKAPDSVKREEKIKDLDHLFINMHHLINEFRPHQARETLRVMLHVQRRKRVQVAERFREHLDKVQETIQEALDGLPVQNERDEKLIIPLMVDDYPQNINFNNPDGLVKTRLTDEQSAVLDVDDLLSKHLEHQFDSNNQVDTKDDGWSLAAS